MHNNTIWTSAVKEDIYELAQEGLSKAEIGRKIIKMYGLPISDENARVNVRKILSRFEADSRPTTSDKKTGEFSWREASKYIQDGQQLFKKAKQSQDKGKFSIDTDKPVYIMVLGDAHFGSWGTDYTILEKLTDEILNTPNLYVVLVGDLVQMSIKLRNMLEVADNALPPKHQMAMLASWFEEIKHKVIASTFDNHAVMREEAVVGYSKYAEIFERTVIYTPGIGHLDLTVGKQTYKLAIAHFFNGRSIENPCHGQMRYMRREGVDREIALSGDSHVPGVIKYVDGEMTRCALNCGTAQTNSGYAKRFFSLFTHPVFPVIKLDAVAHEFTPYWSLKEAVK